MGVSEITLFYIFVVGSVGLTAGLWPILVGGREGYDKFFSLGNAFGGGVFLGAALIDRKSVV